MISDESAASIQIDDLPPSRRSLRVAVVTETYPPEVNGVALTAAQVVQGLQRRDHHISLIRPRQSADANGSESPRLDEVLLRGLPIPAGTRLE